MKGAMQLQLNILTQLNWIDFRFKSLLSSYSMMCSPWRLLSVIESSVKSKLPTTNYLLPWKVHLYYKMDGNPSEILRTSASKLCKPWPRHAVCTIDDDVLIWHTPKLCTWSLHYTVFCVHSLLPLFCLSTQSCNLAALTATDTCMNLS